MASWLRIIGVWVTLSCLLSACGGGDTNVQACGNVQAQITQGVSGCISAYNPMAGNKSWAVEHQVVRLYQQVASPALTATGNSTPIAETLSDKLGHYALATTATGDLWLCTTEGSLSPGTVGTTACLSINLVAGQTVFHNYEGGWGGWS